MTGYRCEIRKIPTSTTAGTPRIQAKRYFMSFSNELVSEQYVVASGVLSGQRCDVP
jgi:hypothetical protein